MRLSDVVLFGHLAAVIITFAVAAILLTAQRAGGHAATTAEVRTWTRVAHRLHPVFPLLAAVLLGLGAWLVHLSAGRFRWSDGWVLTAVAALAVMELVGALVLAPRGRRLGQLIARADDGPLDGRTRRAVCDPLTWAATHLNLGLAAGVVLTMTTKPSASSCVLIITIAGALAAGVGALGASHARQTRTTPAPVHATATAATTTDTTMEARRGVPNVHAQH